MVDSKIIYEQTTADGQLYGKIDPSELTRFSDTAKHLCRSSQSLLDVGCFCGEWLNYVTSKCPWISSHLGIDIAQNKIDEGKRLFPFLNLLCLSSEQIGEFHEPFDTVTCLEVLEHIPDWFGVFESLFKVAHKQVLITVPYQEKIIQTPCIHCGQITPLYGHLKSYSQEDFPHVSGWNRKFVKLHDRRKRVNLKRLYRRLTKPRYMWLLVDYRSTVS